MDWNLAITRNHALLLAIVAELFAMLRRVDGGGGGPLSVGCADTVSERGLLPGQSFTLPRHLYAAIMLILRPAESAIRRLIIIAARGLVLKPRASRPVPAGLASFASSNPSRTPSFQLIDPLKQFDPDLWDQNFDPAGSMQEVEPFDAALAHHQAQRAALPVNATLLQSPARHAHCAQRSPAPSPPSCPLARAARSVARRQGPLPSDAHVPVPPRPAARIPAQGHSPSRCGAEGRALFCD